MSMRPEGAGGPSAAGPGVAARPVRATRVGIIALVRMACSFARTTGGGRPPAGRARRPMAVAFTGMDGPRPGSSGISLTLEKLEDDVGNALVLAQGGKHPIGPKGGARWQPHDGGD